MKSYPLDYFSNGKLMVDPEKMKSDSFQGLGCVAGYVIARYFEWRGFDFEVVSRKIRFVIAILAIAPAYVSLALATPYIKHAFGSPCSKFLMFFVFAFYLMNLVPWVMKFFAKKK